MMHAHVQPSAFANPCQRYVHAAHDHLHAHRMCVHVYVYAFYPRTMDSPVYVLDPIQCHVTSASKMASNNISCAITVHC